jgi:hypothetical protein
VSQIEDQGLVEEFVAAALDPPLHDRVHAGHPDPAEYNRDPGINENSVVVSKKSAAISPWAWERRRRP